jgi:hypothetical protein
MMGAHQLLTMLRQRSCPAILNSNKELIGPWNDGALLLGSKWALQAKRLGLVYFAQVLAPGIYGKTPFELFHQTGQQHLRIATFATDAAAEAWLMRLH